MNWILIITILGSSPTAIPGFSSYEECNNAGNKWKTEVLANHPIPTKAAKEITYVCVQNTGHSR